MDITVVVVCGRTHGPVRILTPRSMITNKAYYSSTFFAYSICTARVNSFCSAADHAIRTKGLHLTPIYMGYIEYTYYSVPFSISTKTIHYISWAVRYDATRVRLDSGREGVR